MKGLVYLNKDGKMEFSEYALSIQAIKQLWDRDDSPGKERAYKELSFIVLATDLSKTNPYREYSKEERVKILIDKIFDGNFDLGDKLFLNALKYVKESTRSMAKEHLSNAIEALNNISAYLKSVNLTLTDESGRPIHNVKQFQEVAQRTAKDVQNLIALKKIVDDEDREQTSIRAGGEEEMDL